MIAKVGQALDAEVLLSDRVRTRLRALWADGPLDLVFLRRFG